MAALLAVAVGVTIAENRKERATPPVVQGAVPAELVDYFHDPAVVAAFARHDLDVRASANGHDFSFAAATTDTGAVPFPTPVVIVTSSAIADRLARLGVARETGGTWVFDVARYVSLVIRGRVDRALLVAAPDPAASAAGAAFAAVTATAANGGRPLATVAAADATLPRVGPVFLAPSERARSEHALLDDFLSAGAGGPGAVVVDEAALLDRAAAAPASIPRGTVLMYPSPGAPLQPVFRAGSAAGAEVGRLLQTDPALRDLALRHGYRAAPTTTFVAFAHQNGVHVSAQLPPPIDPPTAAGLGALTTKLDDALYRTFDPTP